MFPFSFTRAPRKADILLDSTCFSTADLDYSSESDADSDNYDPHGRIFNFFPAMANPSGAKANVQHHPYVSNNTLDNRARYTHPTLPTPSLFSTLFQPARFVEYIKNLFPFPRPINDIITLTEESPEIKETIYKDVNATAANTLLSLGIPSVIVDSAWLKDFVFNNARLPKPFDDTLFGSISGCWDNSEHVYVNFPETTTENSIQDWLNHLAHALGVKHGLIQPIPEETPLPNDLPPAALSHEPEEVLLLQEEFMVEHMHANDGEQQVDSGTNDDTGTAAEGGGIEVGEIAQATVEKRNGYVIAEAEDRSFSMISHKNPPTGGYRQRKPDIVLLNRNLRHFLHGNGYRPRWHQIEAIVEVSASAPRADMVRQIFEKTAIMFEAQPFRQFVTGLAFRGTGAKKVEYCFLLIDRSGACITDWTEISGFGGVQLACIIYALSYAKPEVLGIDPSMTIDPISGDVLSVKAGEEDYRIVKHIHSAIILFGRGTHVFIVEAPDGRLVVLKDSWVLVGHGLSETVVLETIRTVLQKDSSARGAKFRKVYNNFIIGEDIGGSTKDRRGYMAHQPPERQHRRVVNGPIGDPLTSFRSREEFVKVLLDCVEWLEYLHVECKIVHGDLSVTNIVIYREPRAHPPRRPVIVKKNIATSSKPNTTAQVTQSEAEAQVIQAAPLTGVDDSIPVVGVVIDYDYAREIGTLMDRTSGTLPFMPLAALDKKKRGKFTHSPADDLESLLQTVLVIVCFTSGPYAEPRRASDHVPTARWFNETDREQLFKDKSIDLMSYKDEIEDHITEYWQPFVPYLRRLVELTWPVGKGKIMPSDASHESFKVILKEALQNLKKHPETPANYAITVPVLKKRGPLTKAELGRYPYALKFSRGEGSERIPRFTNIKHLSVWKDSINA